VGVIWTVSIGIGIVAWFAVHMTGWEGTRYVRHAILPLAVACGFWWYTRTRTLADADARPSDLEASQELVALGLSEAEAMELAVRAMLGVPHARLVERGAQMSWCRVYSALGGSSEFCVANVVEVSPTRLKIRSRPISIFQYVDWGRNRRNVKRVVEAMQRLHPELELVAPG
jgi:hypothetical protein